MIDFVSSLFLFRDNMHFMLCQQTAGQSSPFRVSHSWELWQLTAVSTLHKELVSSTFSTGNKRFSTEFSTNLCVVRDTWLSFYPKALSLVKSEDVASFV